MQKELLLAISDDRAASYNLRFLKEVFDSFCDLKLTLFYVAPRLSTWEIDPRRLTPRGAGFDEMTEHKKTKGECALDDAVRWIKDFGGCSGENVTTKVTHSKGGTVRELIEEMSHGLYDALLLGRKGFSWFEEIFEHSVSHDILWHDIDFPLWVCKKPMGQPRNDLLVCLDGSPASLRMVDHAGYVLAREAKHTVTLFHVTSKGYAAAGADRIFEDALACLAENGVEEDRIELKMVKGHPVKATLKEAAEGNYFAVAVGKHGGEENHKMKGLFPSSVTVQLLRQLDCSLWISK